MYTIICVVEWVDKRASWKGRYVNCRKTARLIETRVLRSTADERCCWVKSSLAISQNTEAPDA